MGKRRKGKHGTHSGMHAAAADDDPPKRPIVVSGSVPVHAGAEGQSCQLFRMIFTGVFLAWRDGGYNRPDFRRDAGHLLRLLKPFLPILAGSLVFCGPVPDPPPKLILSSVVLQAR